MKLIICFIDDSKFEHDLVREQIATCDQDVEFVQAYSFQEAEEALGSRTPALFLLDLWGKDEEVSQPVITPKEELLKALSSFPTLDAVYKDLDSFEGDAINEYLKRFFAVVDEWRSMFERACGRAGQNRKYGLSNLRQVRAVYPGAPAVFYTRKSLINDAVAMFKAGGDGLFIKPTGTNDYETRHLTGQYAPLLIKELKQIIKSKGHTK